MNTVCRFLCGSFPRSHANQQPGTNRVTSDESTSPGSRFPSWPPRCAPDTPPLRISAKVLGRMKEYYLLAACRSGRDPSSGPRRLVRTPIAVHLLPPEKESRVFGGTPWRAPATGPIWPPIGRPSVPPSHFPTERKFERKIDINTPWAREIVPIPLSFQNHQTSAGFVRPMRWMESRSFRFRRMDRVAVCLRSSRHRTS